MDRATRERLKQQAQQQKPPTSVVELPTPAVLTFSCGHTRPVEKFLKKKCPQCAEQEHAEFRRKQNESRRNKPKQRKDLLDKGRLPDGAIYTKAYSAERQEWTATLTIPGCPVFSATAGGSFPAERECDDQYRRWLMAQEGKQ